MKNLSIMFVQWYIWTRNLVFRGLIHLQMQKCMSCVVVEAFVDVNIMSFAFRQKHLNRFGIKK